jgi:hypothetical protein
MRKPGFSLTVVLWILAASTGSLIAQVDPPRPDCCRNIWMAGCNLGWASSLSWATEIRERWEAPDQAMFDLLTRAAQFIQASHAGCSAFNPAWPDAEAKSAWLLRWRDVLRARPDSTTRKQLSRTLGGALSLGDELKRQKFIYQGSERESNLPSCAEKYFKLGYILSYAQHHFQLAAEAIRLGNANVPEIIANSRSWLVRMQAELAEFARISTGPCVDLTDKNLPARVTAIQEIQIRPDNLTAVMGLVDGVWGDLDSAIAGRCGGAGTARGSGRSGLPVNQASAGHFVGRFNLSDPIRTEAEYNGTVIFSSDGTFTSVERGTTLRPNIRNGSGIWSFDAPTLTFTIQWQPGGRFAGIVSGNTGDFTIAGKWGDGLTGRLRVYR